MNLVAEPYLEDTPQRQMDWCHLKHALSLGYARCVKFCVKMKDQVCESCQESKAEGEEKWSATEYSISESGACWQFNTASPFLNRLRFMESDSDLLQKWQCRCGIWLRPRVLYPASTSNLYSSTYCSHHTSHC